MRNCRQFVALGFVAIAVTCSSPLAVNAAIRRDSLLLSHAPTLKIDNATHNRTLVAGTTTLPFRRLIRRCGTRRSRVRRHCRQRRRRFRRRLRRRRVCYRRYFYRRGRRYYRPVCRMRYRR